MPIRTIADLHAVLSSIKDLSPNHSALVELNDNFVFQPRIDLLNDSGVVELLMQLLVRPTFAGVDATELRLIVSIFRQIATYTGGSNLLATYGAVNKLVSLLLLPSLPLMLTTAALELVTTVSRNSSLPSEHDRRTAFALLLSHMR